jgi:hypothetical protein
MRYFPLPHFDHIAETLGRVCHTVSRGIQLTDAIFGVTIGTGVALGSAALLRLSDGGLLRLMTDLATPGAPPDIEATRTVLVLVVFGGVIWTATNYRKAREWFNPKTGGSRP